MITEHTALCCQHMPCANHSPQLSGACEQSLGRLALTSSTAWSVSPALQIDLSDGGMRALLDEAKSAALAGWSGKQVIHPKQVLSKDLI